MNKANLLIVIAIGVAVFAAAMVEHILLSQVCIGIAGVLIIIAGIVNYKNN